MINSVISLNGYPDWQLTGIYCPPYAAAKIEFWNLTDATANSSTLPWTIIGDFNDICNQSEKTGGRPFASSSKHTLCDDLNRLSLFDLGFSGYDFTWNNGQEDEHNIQQRIDRGLANAAWCMLFPSAQITHLTAIASDHCPIVLETQNHQPKGRKPFRFENMWLSDPNCATVVDNAWNFVDMPPPVFTTL